MTEPVEALLRDVTPAAAAAHPFQSIPHGGLWMRAALPGFTWPADLPEPAEQPEGEQRRRRANWLLRLLRRLFGQLLPSTRIAKRATSESLTRNLMASYRQLSVDNVKSLAPMFAPFGAGSLPSLAAVSEQGVLWALAIADLRKRGPAGAASQLYDLNTIAGLDAKRTTGDCVVLHRLLEALIADAVQWDRVRVPAATARRSGGLRQARTLCAIPPLRAAGRPWSHAIEALAEQSPLTQLVYADLFPFRGAARTPRFASLFHSPSPAPTDLWITHLAHSLIGAMCSPAPSEERRLQAEAAVEEARRTSRTRRGEDPRVSAARLNLERVERACNDEYWMRTELLGGIVRGSLVFHIRFIDMLVRLITNECGERMRTHRLGPRDEARDFFFEGDSALCRRHLESLLWGGSRRPHRSEWLNQNANTIRALRPNVDADTKPDVPITPKAFRRLVSRYTEHAIPLPMRGQWAYTPQEIWNGWTAAIANRLLGEVSTTVEEEE